MTHGVGPTPFALNDRTPIRRLTTAKNADISSTRIVWNPMNRSLREELTLKESTKAVTLHSRVITK